MHGRHIGVFVAALAGFALAFTPVSHAQRVNWPVYRADALEYATNSLPSPIVVYVYTSDAKLVSVLSTPRGSSNEAALRKIGKMIADQRFTDVPKAKLADTAKSLKYFLLDQGYDIHKIVSSQSKYTLILTGWVVRKTDCQFYTDIQNKYKTVIRSSMPKLAGGEPLYSVAILQVGSSKQTLRCGTK